METHGAKGRIAIIDAVVAIAVVGFVVGFGYLIFIDSRRRLPDVQPPAVAEPNHMNASAQSEKPRPQPREPEAQVAPVAIVRKPAPAPRLLNPVTPVNDAARWSRAIDVRPGTAEYTLPEEYDYRIAFVRHCERGSLTQTFVHDGCELTWVVGWHETVACFEGVDGRANDRNFARVIRPRWIESGQPHETLVQVRRHAVRAFFDGEFVSSWEDFVRLSGKPASERKLGVGFDEGSSTDTVEILKMELLPLRGSK
jgi:hypothetical protein